MRRSFAVFSVAATLVAVTACGSSDSSETPANQGSTKVTVGAAIVPGVLSGQFQFGFSDKTPDLTQLLP